MDEATKSEANALHPVVKKQRGPDKKPRKQRMDNPGRNLPSYTEAHRIARERGNTVGRVAGSRNGWTKAEQGLDWEMARAKAKIEVAFWEYSGEWAKGEALQVLYRSIDRGLWSRHSEMLRRREA